MDKLTKPQQLLVSVLKSADVDFEFRGLDPIECVGLNMSREGALRGNVV